MAAIETPERTYRCTLKFYCLACLLLSLWVAPADSAVTREEVYVCNKGDIELLYASLGTFVQLLGASARIEGLYPIPPGECRDVMPLGMTDVTVAFFHVDKTGQLGNVVYSLENAESGLKKMGLDRMCVELGRFKDSNKRRRQSLSQFVQSWTPPCPPGRVSAQNSFMAWGGRNFVYTIDLTPSLDDPVLPLTEDTEASQTPKGRSDDNIPSSHDSSKRPTKDGRLMDRHAPATSPIEHNKLNTQEDTAKIHIKTFEDGAQYEGHMKDEVPHGRGVMKWPDGGQYDGEWRSGNRDGQGTMKWPDGRQFAGSWTRNEPNSGSGIWTLRDGRTFTGRLVNDLPDGGGKTTWPDGREYEGNWKNGKPEGMERWKWPDGRTFRGRSDDPTLGQWGTLTWPDGRSFYGPLKDFKPHGEGKVTLPDGSRFKSLWENGVLIKKLGGH